MRSGALLAGRYRLSQPIGAGSMGHVWRARDERLGRDIAIKVVDLGRSSSLVSERQFEREVLATARLSHPNIVTTFDGGTDGHVAYLVMELLTGESLADRLRRGPLPLADAARVAAEVARALVATHEIGVVHCDIKPGNVMLTPAGVKVLDFGIAQLADADATTSPDIVGTAAFMAPERASGGRAAPASDVYSLGCVLFAMLTGRVPFAGDNIVAVARAQVEAPVPSVTPLRPDAPAALDALVRRMLAKDPGARPDAASVAAELRELGRPAPPPPVGRPVIPDASGTRVLPLPAAPIPARPVAPAPPPNRWFRRGLGVILVAIAALVVFAAAWFGAQQLFGRPGAAASPSPSPTKSSQAPKPVPKPTPTPTPPAPTLPSLPTIPQLPTLPSFDPLGMAVDGVTAALDNWTPTGHDGDAVKARLTADWSAASAKILAGKQAKQAVQSFQKELKAARDGGFMAPSDYATISVALAAVDVLI